MAGTYTKYPQSLDDSTSLPVATDKVTPVKAEVVNRLREAVLALEAELGIDPSSTFGTVRARLDALEIGAGGGGAIDVLFNGSLLVNNANSIDFVGDISVTTSISGRARVEVPGCIQTQETISVSSDGQTTFSLTNTPATSSAVLMFVNGFKQRYGTDYSVSARTVTYSGAISLLTTDEIEFWYVTSLTLGSVTSSRTEYTRSANGTIDLTSDDSVLFVITASTAATVNLPADPAVGQPYVIIDVSGNAGTNNITLVPAGSHTINGDADYVIADNHGSASVIFNTSSYWSKI